MKRMLLTSLTSLALLLGLTACGNQVAQSKKYFRIKATETTASTEQRPMTLVVKRPKALSILGGRPMVATRDDDSLVQLSHHFWLESPKVLLQDIFKNWAAQHWQTVSYHEPAETDYQVLESRILAFEKQQQLALVSLEFQLYDQDRQLLMSRELHQQQPIEGDGYRAFARAVGQAVDQILLDLAHEL
jgi:ABC-type uncharacterized transport system auxiliary subunit